MPWWRRSAAPIPRCSRFPMTSAPENSRLPKPESSTAVAVEAEAPPPDATLAPSNDPEAVQNAVFTALEKAGVRLQVYSVEVHGNELVLQLGVVQSLLASAMSQDAQRQVVQAASQAAGRPLKLKLAPKPASGAVANNGA